MNLKMTCLLEVTMFFLIMFIISECPKSSLQEITSDKRNSTMVELNAPKPIPLNRFIRSFAAQQRLKDARYSPIATIYDRRNLAKFTEIRRNISLGATNDPMIN